MHTKYQFKNIRKLQTCTPQCKGRYINDQPDRTILQFVPIRLSFSFRRLSSSVQYWLVEIRVFVESFFSCSKNVQNEMKLFVSWIAFLRLRVAFFIKNLKTHPWYQNSSLNLLIDNEILCMNSVLIGGKYIFLRSFQIQIKHRHHQDNQIDLITTYDHSFILSSFKKEMNFIFF